MSPREQVHINGVANDTYFIVVDHAQLGGESNFSLTLSPGDCPNAPAPIECALDDHCEGDAICHNGQCLIAPAADAACGVDFLVELDGPGTYEGTTQGAPFRATGTCSESDSKGEVAHRIRFPEATSVCVDTIGSSFDTVLYVRGQFCEFNEDGCNDDLSALSVSQSKLQFDAFANTDYFVFVDGWNLDPNAEGAYQLNIFPGPCNEVPGPCAKQGIVGDCKPPSSLIDRVMGTQYRKCSLVHRSVELC